MTEAEIRADERERCAQLVPTNWLDPLLTGPRAVIGKPPYNCPDIERLLSALAAAIRTGNPGAGVPAQPNRDAFEDWMRSHYPGVHLERAGGNGYTDHRATIAWQAVCAAGVAPSLNDQQEGGA